MQEKVLRQVSKLPGLSYEELSSTRTRCAAGRSAPPEEMAGVVVWLLSDASSYITGQTIYVDGGYLSRPDPTVDDRTADSEWRTWRSPT